MTNRRQLETITVEIEQLIASMLDSIDDTDYDFAKATARSIEREAKRLERAITVIEEDEEW